MSWSERDKEWIRSVASRGTVGFANHFPEFYFPIPIADCALSQAGCAGKLCRVPVPAEVEIPERAAAHLIFLN